MKKFIAITVFLLMCIYNVFPQEQLSSSEILQKIKRLNVLGSALFVAAHPDDENTRLLTYLNREMNFRTGYISITRGDGGQNLVGKEQSELLGLIRTQELIAARKIDGAEQFFTRANDFGYSKNPEETFRIWNKDTILSDMVWVIRNFKPDVIISRFPTTGEGGHGHHTASAILAVEAFDAAADPKKFPWQLNHTEIWQAKRIFWNTFNFGSNNTTSPDQLKIDVGNFNFLTGKSVGEIAAESRSMHKSQGFGSAKTRGSTIEFFKQLKGDSAKINLFENIDMTWRRIQASSVSKIVDDCINNFDSQNPSKSIPQLISAYNAIQQLSDKDHVVKYWKDLKSAEVRSLIINCSGLWLESSANIFSTIPGKKIELSTQIINRSNAIVKLNKIFWGNGTDSITDLVLKPNELYTFKHSTPISTDIPFSGPYWLNSAHDEGYFTVSDPQLIGKPENKPALSTTFELEIEGWKTTIDRPVVHKSVDPIKGEVYRPFEIIPPVTINFSSKSFVIKNKEAEKIQLYIKVNSDSIKGKVKLNLTEGWNASPDIFELNMLSKGTDHILETTIAPSKQNSIGTLQALFTSGNETVSKSIHRIEYDHIPYQFMLSDAKVRLVSLDLVQTGKNIGYIPGAGDEVAENLIQVGYNVTILTEEVLEKKNLSEFDAVVTGIRAFNTNEWLQNYDKKLLNFVKQGGNLVIQYNTNNRIGPLTAKIFPYPFTISRERVTDENAEVRFLNPAHPALNVPNKITQEDFKDWKQERGIYFATEVDSAYEKIFSMNDPGDKPLDGSLIIGKYGKGNFVYTGLVFFRELPAGVSGAYKLFVNLLSLPKNN
jgi:LmbE family N-acetylglucosaminyl deacetylase